jgi:hypothetical protein
MDTIAISAHDAQAQGLSQDGIIGRIPRQCQVLERTQPMLPTGFGYVEITHDQKAP